MLEISDHANKKSQGTTIPTSLHVWPAKTDQPAHVEACKVKQFTLKGSNVFPSTFPFSGLIQQTKS